MAFRSIATVFTALAATASSQIVQVEDSLPSSPVPFVVPQYNGPKVLLADDVFRTLAGQANTGSGSGNPAAGGFSMLLTDGKPNRSVPPH